MARQRKKYTKEFIEESVNLALKLPSIAKAAEDLGIPIGTLHGWIQRLKGKKSLLPNNQSTNEPNIAALIEENRRLHKELAIAKEEREILKKASAYFAQHQK